MESYKELTFWKLKKSLYCLKQAPSYERWLFKWHFPPLSLVGHANKYIFKFAWYMHLQYFIYSLYNYYSKNIN